MEAPIRIGTCLLLTACLALGVVAVAPTSAACGFNDDIIDLGVVHVYLDCTRPTVDVHADRAPTLP